MPRTGVPYEDVVQTIQILQKAGLNPSIRMIREKLGKGSLTTIAEHKRSFEAEQSEGPTEALPDPVARHLIKGAKIFWQELVDAAQYDIDKVCQDTAKVTAALEQRLQAANDEVLALKDTLGTQAQTIDHLEKAAKLKSDELADRDSVLQSQAVDMSRIRAELESLETQTVELKAETASTKQSLSETEIDRARLTERIERQAVEHAKDKTTLQKHFNEYKDRLVTMSDDVSEANAARREAERTAIATEKRTDNANQENKRLQSEVSELNGEVRFLTEKLGEARGQFVAFEKRMADEQKLFDERLKSKNDTVSELQSALEEAQQVIGQNLPKGTDVAQSLIGDSKGKKK